MVHSLPFLDYLEHELVKSLIFLDFMYSKWGYLISDNGLFWKPYMSSQANAIRNKCVSYGCNFPLVDDPNGGFNIFAFIDNTLNATCRPGGGPSRDGPNAPRNDEEIQNAFKNGWKVYNNINNTIFYNFNHHVIIEATWFEMANS